MATHAPAWLAGIRRSAARTPRVPASSPARSVRPAGRRLSRHCPRAWPPL